MVNIKEIEKELRKYSNPKKVAVYQNFFKTKPGQYGEGDIFLGINSPDLKKVVEKYKEVSLEIIKVLLESKIHEERVLAVRILVEKFSKTDKEAIYNFYLKNTKKINNWDLVDISAPYIVGEHLLNNKEERKVLYSLAKSNNLWEKRIAIISTYAFIKNNQFQDTIKISEILLNDKHDLIQKAVGWMLREMGKKDKKLLNQFLDKYHKTMSRTTLRYSIERFPEPERVKYLKGDINL